MRLFLLTLIVVVFAQQGYSQNTYPKGIYKTFNDFVMKSPSDTTTPFRIKTGSDTISHRFYNDNNDKRFRREFAFSDGEHLYIRIKDMMKRFEKSDKGQLKDDGNYHIKAKQIGDKYIYFEDYFTSGGAAFFGGLIAASAARRIKGVVYDYNLKTFNLFKNAEDFEQFLEANHPEYLPEVQKRELKTNGKKKRKKHVEDINKIRDIITRINSAEK